MNNLNAGIDYGMGKVNIDVETGIRFGVIQHNIVGQFWYEDSEGVYFYFCPHCGVDWEEEIFDTCPHCNEIIEEYEFDNIEPTAFKYVNDEYKCFQSYDDPDIFIESSPFYTLCDFCSPCAPGAGYIMNQNENGTKAYCFGHDFFEGGKAPYKVFSVKTGKEVK